MMEQLYLDSVLKLKDSRELCGKIVKPIRVSGVNTGTIDSRLIISCEDNYKIIKPVKMGGVKYHIDSTEMLISGRYCSAPATLGGISCQENYKGQSNHVADKGLLGHIESNDPDQFYYVN